MQNRLDYYKKVPEAMRHMVSMQRYVDNSGLEKSLLELIKLRASQINGCAYCIDMHTKDARAAGESEQRLYALSAWQETTFYTNRERAALVWTEGITQIGVDHAPDVVYEQVKEQFTDIEIVNLTMAIITINAWNCLAIGFRSIPGSYKPHLNDKREE